MPGIDAPFVIKVGGAVTNIAGALTALPGILNVSNGPTGLVLVHGGGQEISRWMDRAGLPVTFKNGLRCTDSQALEVAIMVLRGLVNTQLVAALATIGIRAVGVSGVDAGLLNVRKYADPDLGLVGEAVGADVTLLLSLLQQQIVPVIAPIARDPGGDILNVNADSACGAIAGALGARMAVFLTDVAGVLDDAGRIYASLTPGQIDMLITNGTINGGMVPKVYACLVALQAGAKQACIADGRDVEILPQIIAGTTGRFTVISDGVDS